MSMHEIPDCGHGGFLVLVYEGGEPCYLCEDCLDFAADLADDDPDLSEVRRP